MEKSNFVKKSVTLSRDAALKFFECIDWESLKKFVKEKYNIDGDTFDAVMDFNGPHFSIVWKEDIKPKCGVFGNCLSKAHLCNFGGSIRQNVIYDNALYQEKLDAGNYDFTYEDIGAERKPPYLWTSFDIRYFSKGGGSNGVNLFNARYSERDGWEFS